MKRLSTLICALFLLMNLNAQGDETLFGAGGIRLTGIWGGSTNGIVNIGNEFSLNNGGFFTFELNKNFLIGWSGYGSGTDLEDGRRAKIDGNDLLLGYGFQSYKSIHPFVYLKTGQGGLKIDDNPSDKVFVIEPSVGIEANVTRWFRFGVDAGYRFVNGVDSNGLTDNDFSSPFIGLRFKFGWSWGH